MEEDTVVDLAAEEDMVAAVATEVDLEVEVVLVEATAAAVVTVDTIKSKPLISSKYLTSQVCFP